MTSDHDDGHKIGGEDIGDPGIVGHGVLVSAIWIWGSGLAAFAGREHHRQPDEPCAGGFVRIAMKYRVRKRKVKPNAMTSNGHNIDKAIAHGPSKTTLVGEAYSTSRRNI